jgi:hypothetical protein
VDGGRVALSDSEGRIETIFETILPSVGLDKAEKRRLHLDKLDAPLDQRCAQKDKLSGD